MPRPGVNKWRLVIDYRYFKSCLEGDALPLPVIEDVVQRQHRNHLCSILHFEIGFDQMPVTEEGLLPMAFCTPRVVYQ